MEINLTHFHFLKTKQHHKYLITESFYAHLAGILSKKEIYFVMIAKRKKITLLLSAIYHLEVATERCSAK